MSEQSEFVCSIVIPWHSGIDDLRRAVRSVLAQDWRNLELIVVANGVSDADYKQVLSLCQDPRCRVERLAKAGASLGRNHGLDLARGDLTFMLDGDDEFLPGKIARFVDMYRTEGFDVAFSRGHRVRGHEVAWPWPIGYWDGEQPIAEFFFCDGCTISTSAIVISANARQKMRFLNPLPYEDPDFVIRAEQLGLDIRMIPDILYNYYDDRNEHRLSRALNWTDRLTWIDTAPTNVSERARAAFRARCVGQHLFPSRPLECLRWFADAYRLNAIPRRDLCLFFLRGLIPQTFRNRLVNTYFKQRERHEAGKPSEPTSARRETAALGSKS